jgi:dTDP-4-dehydrorhamnose reductase
MRAIVFGASGLVGRHLVRELANRGEVFTSLPQNTPSVTHVFNAIGYTNIERAEREPEAAFQANEGCARSVAETARDAGAVLVHISTEFVYDGNQTLRPFAEDDVPEPRSVYARSKRGGEVASAATTPKHHVVRLQNLYGLGGASLLSRLCSHGPDCEALDSERLIAPMWAGTAARLVCDVAETGHFGVWHVSARGATTYSDFAAQLGVQRRKATSAALGLHVPRPSIMLKCRRMELLGMSPPPTWQQSLDEFLAAKR